MSAQLDAFHSDFVERILEPARAALGAGGLSGWLEQQAEVVARVGRRRAHIELGPPVRAALQIKAKHLEYSAFKEMRGMNWTGSIDLSDAKRSLAVARVGTRDIRALEAHELGHALLTSDKRMWKIFRESSLVVDPAIERLTDDAARAILLPDSLLHELIAADSGGNLASESKLRIWESLPRIAATAIVPDRIASSRLARLLVQGEAALLCYTMQLIEQPDLFSESKPLRRTADEEKSVATVRWIMSYRWFGEIDSREYLFADRVGAPSRRVTLRGTARAMARLKELGAMDPSLMRKIAGEENWNWLNRFDAFTRVAVTDRADTRYIFVLAEPAVAS